MATITKSVAVAVSPDQVWGAVRDWGHVHQRLCPGVLTDCQAEEGARIVTFANGLVANGLVARELIVALDDAARRGRSGRGLYGSGLRGDEDDAGTVVKPSARRGGGLGGAPRRFNVRFPLPTLSGRCHSQSA
jgi:hypothetical protein